MTSLPNHNDFLRGVTPAKFQQYPQGLGIVISKIQEQTNGLLDNDGILNQCLDLLLLDDREGLKNFFVSIGNDAEDGFSQKQLTLVSSLYRITAGYSAPRELGESSELSAEQLYHLSSDFFQSALVFLHDQVLISDTHPHLKAVALSTITEYTEYTLKLIDKTQKEREKIISHSQAEKRTIDSNESGIKRKIKSIILGKGYVDDLKKSVDTQVNPELNANSGTLYKIAGRLRVIDSLLKSANHPGITSLELPSTQRAVLEKIIK